MQPTFAFTLDTELMWGSFDRMPIARFEALYPDIRGTIRAILEQLDSFAIPATWAVVGHLFLDRCERDASGIPHPELVPHGAPVGGGARLEVDPCAGRLSAPLWYGDDILDRIQGARTRHEIGSHSFSHPIFSDPAMTREAASAEVAACVAVARRRGIELRSFVFPRNEEGFHEVLPEHGFTAFRGVDRAWHGRLPRPIRRGAHLLDHALAIPPEVHRPIERLPGLWDVTGSMLLLHRVGVRRAIPMDLRVRRARSGLGRAIEDQAVFHLWTHPMNLAHDRDAMLRGLRAILRDVANLRDRGLIVTATMADIAAAAASGPTSASPIAGSAN